MGKVTPVGYDEKTRRRIDAMIEAEERGRTAHRAAERGRRGCGMPMPGRDVSGAEGRWRARRR